MEGDCVEVGVAAVAAVDDDDDDDDEDRGFLSLEGVVALRWTATIELSSRSARRGPQGPREGRSRDIAGGE